MNPLFILAAIGGLLALIFGSKKKLPPAETASGGHAVGGRVAPEGAELTAQLRSALDRVISDYGVEVAKNVERIYRLETANFTSGQFFKTNTAGMHAPKATYPFGWDLAGAGLVAGDFLPTISMDENAGGTFQWVVFKRLPDAIHFLGYFLNKYDNNAGRWNSTEPARQAAYTARLAGIDTPIVYGLTSGFGGGAPV